MRLTIGMATYKDYHGVYFTLQSLRWYQDLGDTELVVVDNFGCQATENFCKSAGAVYHRFTGTPGTAAPRDKVFDLASGTHVLCIDSHVLLAPGSVARLRQFYRDNPESNDLYQGPLQYDSLGESNTATEFDSHWSHGMWGQWQRREGVTDSSEPFEINSHGLGLFTCRKAAWPGFNPQFRGFGGEEGYIHAKFRKAGARCVCLPWLRWAHRFDRPEGVPYPLTVEDKMRNHLLGFVELGMDPTPVLNHFQTLLPQEAFSRIVLEVLRVGRLPEIRSDVAETPAPPALEKRPVIVRADGIVMGHLPEGVTVRRSGIILGARRRSPAQSAPKVSCVMRTHARAHLPYRPLDEAVESFLRQGYPHKELLILNDTPGQWVVVDAPGVRVVNLADKLTLGRKSNYAVRLTGGEVIAIWDDDDIHLPHRLQLLVDALGDYEAVTPAETWFQDSGPLRRGGCGFHFGLFTREAFEKVGGYADDAGADADQRLAARLHRKIIDLHPSRFVSIYRWNPGHRHLSWPDGADAKVAREYGRGRFEIKPAWHEDYPAAVLAAIDRGDPPPLGP